MWIECLPALQPKDHQNICETMYLVCVFASPYCYFSTRKTSMCYDKVWEGRVEELGLLILKQVVVMDSARSDGIKAYLTHM
jgi:hypothetical protein